MVNPFLNATRSVTISAPPERIWPWIAQIAREDVGWYSYDYVDNGGRESARSLNLDRTYVRGEALPLGSDGSDLGFYVEDLRTNEWLICTNKVRGMSFVLWLAPLDAMHTRLVSRFRLRSGWGSPIVMAVFDAGDFVMLRQTLNGIRSRAEQATIRSPASLTLELFLWVACFVGFLVAEIRTVARPRWASSAMIAAGAAGLTIALVLWQPPLVVDALGAGIIGFALLRDRRNTVWYGEVVPGVNLGWRAFLRRARQR